MTTEQTPATEPVVETPEEAVETPAVESTPPTPAELRAYAERQAEENKTLKRQLAQDRLSQVGLSHESGVGKAIFKDIEKGDYSGDLTVEALRAYAETEYQHSAGTNPNVNSAAAATTRADQLQSAASETPPPPQPVEGREYVEQAHAAVLEPGAGKNEAKASIAAKLSQFAQDHLR